MHGHLHLSKVAAKLRSATADGLLGEPPEEIKALIEKLAQREMMRKTCNKPCSGAPPGAGQGAGN